MPELPEVETVVRAIRPKVIGRVVENARFFVPRQLEPQRPRSVANAIKGHAVRGVHRRGKFILIELDHGTLLIHLRMTGRLLVRSRHAEVGDYERARFTLNDDHVLVFRDPRTLGSVRWYPAGATIEPIAQLGWEPLEDVVTGDMVRAKLARRHIAIKPLLLNQHVWAGVGNIYASEVLWEARIHPAKRASMLSRTECSRLSELVPCVLRRALARGGTTIRDFASPNGQAGSYQREFRVYDRAGLPCLNCGRAIRRIVQAQRSTYFCAGCQKKK